MRNVLVVDDEPGYRDLLGFELGLRGYRVVAAGDGPAALECARREPFDLCICDVKMPRMEGPEVLERMLVIRPGTVVVMTTGYSTLETALDSMRRGASAYILKPYSIDELCRVAEEALSRKAAPAAGRHRAPPKKLLIVDDDMELVEVFSLGLRADGYEVASAGPAEALEAIRRERPDLVLLDLMMPGVGGFDILDEARKEPGLSGVRFIVLTARYLSPRDIDALRARAEDVLTKGSANAEDILRVVRKRLSEARRTS